jgi:hypothetical protein
LEAHAESAAELPANVSAVEGRMNWLEESTL